MESCGCVYWQDPLIFDVQGWFSAAQMIFVRVEDGPLLSYFERTSCSLRRDA